MTISATIDGIAGVYGYGPDPGNVPGWETILAEIPDLSADSIDPEEGDYTSARLRLVVSASSITRRRLLFQAVDAAAELSASIIDSATVVTLSQPLSATPEALYIGGETLRVTSAITASAYNVERGAYNSTATAHAAGARVYLAPTWWRRRIVRLWSGTTQRWIGLLDQAPRTSGDGKTIELVAAHPLSLGEDLSVGEGRESRQVGPGAQYVVWPLDQPFSLPAGMPPGMSRPQAEPFRLGDCLVVWAGDYLTAQIPGTAPTRWEHYIPSPDALRYAELDSPLPDFEEPLTALPVLAIGARISYPTPLHVVEVVGNLLFSDGSQPSTYDDVEYSLFPARWSARLRWATDDDGIAQMRALQAELPEAIVDQLVLGWEGEPVPVIPLCRQLLRLYGLALATTETGALTVRRMAPADVRSEIVEVQPLRDNVQWTNPAVGAIDEVRATYGRLPWDAGSSVNARIEDFDGVRGEILELDLAHLSVTRAPGEGEARILSLAMQRWRGVPMLHVRCVDSVPIGLLDYLRLKRHVSLETPLFPTPDLDLTADVERNDFIGQVISRRWLPRQGAYDLIVHLSSWPMGGLLKLRAPALVVESVPSSAFIATVPDPGWGISGDAGLTWPSYAVPVEAWTADGQVRTATCGVGEATGWSSGSLQMTTTFAVDPDPGDIIRIARGAEGSLALDPREYVILATGLDRYR